MCILCGPDGTPGAEVVDHSIDHPFSLQPESGFHCLECGEHLSKHPDKMLFLQEFETANILANGMQVQYIFGDDGPAFCYSEGRSLFGKPELVVYGSLPPQVLQYMVNRVAEIDPREECELDEVLEGYPVKLVKVRSVREAGMFGAARINEDAEAFQILWPDAEGRWPDDPEFSYGPEAQPIFA